jgi:hypothetical protein
MAVECLEKCSFILSRNVFSNLETENSIHGRLDKGRVREICNGAIRKGRGQWISVVSRCIEPSLAKCLDIVTHPTPKIIEGSYIVLACQLSKGSCQRRVEEMFVLEIHVHPEPRV